MAYDDGEFNDSAGHYINTLVFAVVAGIVSLMLLILILRGSAAVRRYSTFIITIEVGLVLIMAIAIGRIIYFERKAYKRSANALDNRLQVTSCPDYWTRYGTSCYNTMVSPENGNVLFRMPKPDGTSDSTYNIKLSDFDGKSISDVCKKVRSDVGSPWTAVTSVCESYRL